MNLFNLTSIENVPKSCRKTSKFTLAKGANRKVQTQHPITVL
jgi:hypothetical protein